MHHAFDPPSKKLARTPATGSMIAAVLAIAAASPAQERADVNIPDSKYVQVNADGDLVLDGQLVRYWGFIGGVASGGPKRAADVPGDTPEARGQWIDDQHESIRRMVQRIDDLGFNLVRVWEGRYKEPNTFVFLHDYTPGDGSESDRIAFYFNELSKRGIRLWMSSTNRMGFITPDDVDIIDEPATADAWRQAMRQLQQVTGRDAFSIRSSSSRPEGLIQMWDPRWEAMWIKRLGMLADFPNHYKGGLRLGDDPQVVVWEMTNEEFAFRGLFNGKWKALPPYFRNGLLDQWHDYLKTKYKTDEAVTRAWGFLLPGESLAKRSVMLAPLANPIGAEAALNDTNDYVIETLQVHDAEYTRDDFTRQRGGDVIEFFTQLVIAHKQRLEAALDTMGKSCRLSPTVYDSGNSFRIQSSYVHQFADAVSTCSYGKSIGHDPTHRRWPFHSLLDDQPSTPTGWVPWLEQSPVKGKAHFVYETNTDTRGKFKAEYPMILAALGSINRWDIVCWHSYSGKPDMLVDNPFDLKLAVGGDNLVFRGDEVQLSAMKAAAEIFKHRLLDPVAQPTTFVFGRRSLYDPVSMDYGRSYGELGRSFVPTAYRYGVQVRVDPTREDDEVIGPYEEPGVFAPSPVRPTDQIVFDHQHGCLILDSPAVASYTGFFADYPDDRVELPNAGVTFSGITVINPPNMPYPVIEDELYLNLTVASADGKPLAEAGKVMISPASAGFNTGFKLREDRAAKHRETSMREMWSDELLLESRGHKPVLVARVGATITSPSLDGMSYVLKDFHMRTIAKGVVSDGAIRIPADKPVFVVELSR